MVNCVIHPPSSILLSMFQTYASCQQIQKCFTSFVNIQASGVFTTGLLGPCQPLGHRLKTQQIKNFTQCQIVKFVSIFYEYACKIALIRSLFQPKCSKYRSAAGPTGVPRPSWIKSPTSKGKEKDGGRGGKGRQEGEKS